MIKKPVFLIIILLMGTMGCAISYSLIPLAKGNQKINYLEGNPFCISTGKSSIIATMLYRNEEGFLEIFLKIRNHGSSEITFLPQNVKVVYLYKLKNQYYKYQLTTIMPEQWMKKVKRDQAMVAIATGISQGLESFNAGLSSTTGSMEVYDGNATTQINGTFQTMDYTKKLQIEQQHRKELQEMESSFKTQLLNTSAYLLKANTIYPMHEIYGKVMSTWDSSGEIYQLQINIGNDTHIFNFRIPYEGE